MRFSLIILVGLATAFGRNLADETDVPTASLPVKDGKDSTPIDLAQDEGGFEDSEIVGEDEGGNLTDEDEGGFEDSEIVGEDEGVNLTDEEEDNSKGDEKDSDGLESYPADEKTTVENDKGDDAEGTMPNDIVGDAIAPKPDEDKMNEDNIDALPTSELDFQGSDSDSEVGNEPSDEDFGFDGDESQGSTASPIGEGENEDLSDENADGERSDGNDQIPDIEQDIDENSQEDNDKFQEENFDYGGKDSETPFDQAQDLDKTFPSSATKIPGPDEFATESAPTLSPTPYPIPYKSPSLRPVVPYVPRDDDPLKDTGGWESEIEDWFSNESTIEEMEHDKTVIIALSVVFGVMFFFSVFVAYQMLENPDGCCASLCRITVACWCGLIRCICYPCRSVCGCTNPSGGQHMMVPDDGQFTHDLELS